MILKIAKSRKRLALMACYLFLSIPAFAQTHTPVVPHDLSPWSMFLAADIVVKTVMVGLVTASFAAWTIYVAKLIELNWRNKRVKRALRELALAPALSAANEQLSDRSGVAISLVGAAQKEIVMSELAPGKEGIKERVQSRLGGLVARAARSSASGTGILASIGSTGPFVGLFGTVWGIMNSFIGISRTQTTNLAVVAPGIAEALLATAIGLVAAIPAVIFYNHLTRVIGGHRALVGDAAEEILRIVSRDLDRASARQTRFMENSHGRQA